MKWIQQIKIGIWRGPGTKQGSYPVKCFLYLLIINLCVLINLFLLVRSFCQRPLRPNSVQWERNSWLDHFLSVTASSPLSKPAPATVSQITNIFHPSSVLPPFYTQTLFYTHAHKHTNTLTEYKQTPSLWTRTVLFHKCRKCVTIIKLFSRDVYTWNQHCCT